MKRLRFCVLALLAVVAGCDMADYHARIERQKARLKIIDEENKHLGRPLEEPKQRDKDGAEAPLWPVEVFLRLPKGVQNTVPEKGLLHPSDSPEIVVVRYPPETEGDERNVFIALGAARKDDEKDKAGSTLSAAQFRSLVLDTVRGHYRGSTGELKTSRATIDVVLPDGGKHAPFGCDLTVFEGTPTKEKDREVDYSLFHLYHVQREGRQVVVVFQGPSKQKEEMAKAFEKSISTLAVGEAAAPRAELHWKTHRK